MSKRLLGAKVRVHENLRSDVISSDLKYVSRRTSNGDVNGEGGTFQRALSKFVERGSGSFLSTKSHPTSISSVSISTDREPAHLDIAYSVVPYHLESFFQRYQTLFEETFSPSRNCI